MTMSETPGSPFSSRRAEAGAQKTDYSFWAGRPVLVTGHMGFKGAWLCALLSRLGAHTFGFGRDDRRPLLYRDLTIARHAQVEGDVNDVAALRQFLRTSGAEVLFHLAAQPIVLDAYRDPVGTFSDNVLGTVSTLEAAREAPNLKAVIVVTSDKVYRNTETRIAYAEEDPLGGSDPYSGSKAAAEIATAAMVSSFFASPGKPRIATARAGNVIGGGDWAAHRLLPDAGRALAAGQPLIVRNPGSVRPWQHVLDPLAGYLVLAEALAIREDEPFSAWNFGPDTNDALSVSEVADLFVRAWGGDATWIERGDPNAPKEASYLKVDSSKSNKRLLWSPRWPVQQAVTRTAEWYRDHCRGSQASDLVNRDIDAFLSAD